jgi:histidine triad (HIT) family protein
VAKGPEQCVFCAIVAGEAPAHVVSSDAGHVAFLDARPVFPGHVLIVTRVHRATLAEVPADELPLLFARAQRLSAALGRALGAEGTFIALNDRVSQSVPHVHVHVVPRRKGDGLRGFFWPRQKYASDDEAASVAARIRESLDLPTPVLT